MKTKVYNLIVLDETGSMSGAKKQTISGCNETIDSIRTAQKKYSETQEHYVSIFTFHSRVVNPPSRYLVKNQPAASVEHVTGKMYDPDGCTPLYDAVGSTLVDLRATVEGQKLAIGSVTIITDGMENDSQHYTLQQVAGMINALKELGWNFNFIGAGIDVDYVADSLNINNRLSFENSEVGTREMFERQRRARERYYDRVNFNVKCYENMSEADFGAAEATKAAKSLCVAERGYFEEPIAPEDSANQNPDATPNAAPEGKSKRGLFGRKKK